MSIAECKKLVEKSDVKNFMTQMIKIKEESAIIEKLQPCLSEAEAKVTMALIEGESHSGENILDILTKHQELNVLKIISVLSVMQDEKKFKEDYFAAGYGRTSHLQYSVWRPVIWSTIMLVCITWTRLRIPFLCCPLPF